MYDPQKLENLIHKALELAGRELYEAAYKLEKLTIPSTPLTTESPSVQLIFGELELRWPGLVEGKLSYRRVSKQSYLWELPYVDSIVDAVARACDYHPVKVLAAVRKFQAAAEWCRKKTEERRQEAIEIVRGQLADLRELEALVGEKVWEGPDEPEEPKKKMRRVVEVGHVG